MTKNKQVLHVLNGLSSAGIENLSLQLIRYSPADVDCKLLNLDPERNELYSRFQSLVDKHYLSGIIARKFRGIQLCLKAFNIASMHKINAVIMIAMSK